MICILDLPYCSFVLTGTGSAMEQTFGSTCHGAGRLLSRHTAKKTLTSEEVLANLASKGIRIRAPNLEGIQDEAPEAYKDVECVVKVCEDAGISHRVVRMCPIGVIKG